MGQKNKKDKEVIRKDVQRKELKNRKDCFSWMMLQQNFQKLYVDISYKATFLFQFHTV